MHLVFRNYAYIQHMIAFFRQFVAPAAVVTLLANSIALADDAQSDVSILDMWRETPTTILDAQSVGDQDLAWISRPFVIFADSPNHPLFIEQLALIEAEWDPLVERDVLVITDTDPSDASALRTKLRPHGFAIALIDKDGRVMLRKPTPWHIRELTRAIDKSLLRQQEIGRLR